MNAEDPHAAANIDLTIIDLTIDGERFIVLVEGGELEKRRGRRGSPNMFA